MISSAEHSPENSAVRFQRIVLAGFLFLAYILNNIPIVMFVAAIMLLSCVTTSKYTPFYRLYFVIHRTQSPEGVNCACGVGADRFACLLAFILLSIGLLLFHINHPNIAWAIVLFVAGLSTISGTVGFCLGAAIYAAAFERRNL